MRVKHKKWADGKLACSICLSCLPFYTPTFPPDPFFFILFLFFSHCRQAVASLADCLAVFLFISILSCLSPCLSTIYSKARINRESIWTCCGMPFGTLNAGQPWAAICAILCHRGTAMGHCQWHTNIHLSIRSFLFL